MTLPEEAYLLRIFIGENDKAEGRPLYQLLVEKARENSMAGATVLRGFLGFGGSSRVHTTKILRLSQDLPMVVEIVDTEQKIQEFLPLLDTLITEGLVTMEKARVIHYRTRQETDD